MKWPHLSHSDYNKFPVLRTIEVEEQDFAITETSITSCLFGKHILFSPAWLPSRYLKTSSRNDSCPDGATQNLDLLEKG